MKKILFVCHGNICRSPMAEFVMKDLVKKAGLASQFYIESAATSREEISNPVYPPARRKLAEHGISCDGHAARQLTNQDYDKYDLLISLRWVKEFALHNPIVMIIIVTAVLIGILYCSAEANSQYQVDEVQKYLEEKGVTVTQYAFSDSNDLSSVCQKAADENDALYVPTDNTVAANTGIVDGICRPAKKPVFAGEEGICAGCGVATLSISYYDLGYTTGEMAVKILNGESDISTMPIEYTDVTKKYNKAVCDDLGLTAPEGYVEIEA